MTRTDHIEWITARVERVEMMETAIRADEGIVPGMEVEIHYSWKSGHFSKKIRSVLN